MNAETNRRCIATGQARDTAGMVRLVESPDGELVSDVAHKLPGRGYWCTATRAAVEQAAKTRARRGSRTPKLQAALAETIESLLASRCLECLGLAKRAGTLVSGFDKVKKMLRAGDAALLIGAADGAADGKAKLKALGADLPVIEQFSTTELSLALGRENVVHAALSAGPLTQRFLSDTARLGGFRAEAGEHGAGDGIDMRNSRRV